MLSSTNEFPEETVPSTAIFSPGRTSSVSPGITASTGISITSSSEITLITVFGLSPISFLIAAAVLPFARASSVRPSRMKAMITDAASK